MAVTAKIYSLFFDSAFRGEVDFTSATVKFMLLGDSYTPDQDTHQYADDLTDEVTGDGWAAGGVEVANVAATYDAGSNVLKIDGDDISESPVTVADAAYGVLYIDTGTASTSPLICYVDFDGNQSATAGTVAVTWNASGIATVTIG